MFTPPDPEGDAKKRTELMKRLDSVFSKMKFVERDGKKSCKFGSGHYYVQRSDGSESYIDSEGYGVCVSPEGRPRRQRRPAERQADLMKKLERKMKKNETRQLKYEVRWMFAQMARKTLCLVRAGEDFPKRPDELKAEKEAKHKETTLRESTQAAEKDDQPLTVTTSCDLSLPITVTTLQETVAGSFSDELPSISMPICGDAAPRGIKRGVEEVNGSTPCESLSKKIVS
ncbi:hypothetical protein SBOR_4838 [Sclerotinia borealis F-4128]|uniref:Uncharacterized protein n=1 Tax=Sclerotinia borealis (strain F-4128) TaxID=1432307 RepID=W9CFY8_SCLBF|nr:hypothetical protein SBOR_4838 [Sclerotinia borealis F-4128]